MGAMVILTILCLARLLGFCSCQLELETQESHTGTEGGQVSLQCTYKNPPPDYTGPIVIVWNVPDQAQALVLSYHSGTGALVIGDLYKDRVSLQGRDADMTITGLLVTDSSTYRCSVNFLQALENAFVETELTVMVPLKSSPTINDVQDGGIITVINNEQATFACKVFSTLPAATFQWAVGGIPQTSSEESTENNGLIDTTSTITYNPQWKNDQGQTVDCTAQNTVTTTPFTSSVVMDLLVPPTVVEIEAFNSGAVYTVNEGQPTSLTCTSTAKPAPSLTWFIDQTEVNAESTTPTPNEADDGLFDRSSTLSFTPRWSNHMKWVKCVANEGVFSQVKLDINVAVTSIMISDVNNMDGFEIGSNVAVVDNLRHSFICNTTASKPSAEIEWNTGSISVTVGNTTPTGNYNDQRLFDTTRTVTFMPMWSNHEESLNCEGGNTVNSDKLNTYVNLDVQVSPSRATISLQSPQGIITVKDNKTTTISCDAVRARPASSINWTLGTQNIDYDQEKVTENKEEGFKDTKSTLNLESHYFQHQNKTLKCEARNYASEAKSQQITDEIMLNVIIGPMYVQLTEQSDEIVTVVNHESKITCIAHAAHPEADITWFKKNEDISQHANNTVSWESDGRKNTISDLTFIPIEEDFGKLLTCKAEHDAMESDLLVSAKLIVRYATEIVNDEETKTSADKGQTATLPCIASGFPIPDVKWFKNINDSLTELANGTDRVSLVEERNNTGRYIESILIISKVQPIQDHKMYTCIAVNIIGNATHNITLEGRREPNPPTDLSGQTGLTTWENVTITWTAGYDGGFPQHFVVFYSQPDTNQQNQSHAIHHTNFTITNLKPTTEYKVYVIAKNYIGWSDKSETITVKTLEKPKLSPQPSETDNSTGIYAGIGSAIFVLLIVAAVLLVLILRNRSPGPKYVKDRPVLETTFDGVDNPAMTYRDTHIHGGHSHERESTDKDGNPYLTNTDQNLLSMNSKSKEATTSFAVYASPNKGNKIQDYKHEDTAYANVTKPGTQAEPPFFTNGTDHNASPYANVEEKNAQKKEVDTAYADVQTTETRKGKPPIGGKGKKPQRKGKKTKADQADRPYDDVPDESKQQKISTKDVKPSSQPPENPYEVAAITMQKPKPQDANVEGLTYADLDFKGGAKGKPKKPKLPVKPIDDDDAVAYAAVDFSKSGKPN